MEQKINLSATMQEFEQQIQQLLKDADGKGIHAVMFASDGNHVFVRKNTDNVDEFSNVMVPLIVNHSNGYLTEQVLKNIMYRAACFSRGMQDSVFRANWERLEKEDQKAQERAMQERVRKEKELQDKLARQAHEEVKESKD